MRGCLTKASPDNALSRLRLTVRLTKALETLKRLLTIYLNGNNKEMKPADSYTQEDIEKMRKQWFEATEECDKREKYEWGGPRFHALMHDLRFPNKPNPFRD